MNASEFNPHDSENLKQWFLEGKSIIAKRGRMVYRPILDANKQLELLLWCYVTDATKALKMLTDTNSILNYKSYRAIENPLTKCIDINQDESDWHVAINTGFINSYEFDESNLSNIDRADLELDEKGFVKVDLDTFCRLVATNQCKEGVQWVGGIAGFILPNVNEGILPDSVESLVELENPYHISLNEYQVGKHYADFGRIIDNGITSGIMHLTHERHFGYDFACEEWYCDEINSGGWEDLEPDEARKLALELGLDKVLAQVINNDQYSIPGYNVLPDGQLYAHASVEGAAKALEDYIPKYVAMKELNAEINEGRPNPNASASDLLNTIKIASDEIGGHNPAQANKQANTPKVAK